MFTFVKVSYHLLLMKIQEIWDSSLKQPGKPHLRDSIMKSKIPLNSSEELSDQVIKPWRRESNISWWVLSRFLSWSLAWGGVSGERLPGTAALQHEGVKPYSFLLEQELYIFLPFPFHIICFSCLRCEGFFVLFCGFSFSFSSYSNPNKPGVPFQEQVHSRKDGFSHEKNIVDLSYCETHRCSFDFISTVHSTSWSARGSATDCLQGLWCNHFIFGWLSPVCRAGVEVR